MAPGAHRACVLAPTVGLSVTVETNGDGSDEVHLHPAGQGFWVARMLRHLGESPLLCGLVGGESGEVIRSLVGQWDIDLHVVAVHGESPTTIQDRRSGNRVVIAETAPPGLTRHCLDDAYGVMLEQALRADVCVITGQYTQVIPPATWSRLGHDLASASIPVVADVHGEELDALLDGGPVAVLKVSDEDLRHDGLLSSDDEQGALAAIEDFHERGATNVVLSRAEKPVLALLGKRLHRAQLPQLAAADHRGAGDSMTAGLAAALRRGGNEIDMLRLACGAGAANVTRHGLGSATEELVEQLTAMVEVEAVISAAA